MLIFFLLLVFLDNRYEVLPNSIHNKLPIHHPGYVITDLTIKTCSSLNPLSSCMLDPDVWERIDKDIYLEQSWTSSAFLHVRRKKEEEISADDKVILDVKVAKLNPAKTDPTRSEEIWESRSAGIWIYRTARRREVDSHQAVTAIDVLYGPDVAEPRIGWQMIGTPLLVEAPKGLEPRITFRSGAPKPPERPVLKIRQNGKFKIMQAADLHLSTGVGECRSPEPPDPKCEADPRTLEFVGRLLDQEDPDLVVLTGDQVNGETAPDVQSAIFKFADLFAKRRIPFAAIFGNHDDEGKLSRSTSMVLLESLPYSLSSHGPTTVSGVGNYVLEVQAPGNARHSAFSLYLLDSHSYSPDDRQFKGYNWIKDDQIKWFKETASTLRERHRNYGKIHMDMAFIHIPLPEYRHEHNKHVGEWREYINAPNFNSHFKDALVEEGVKVVSCGHDHVNDFCSLEKSADGSKPELWMCYGGAAGFGGYGGHEGYQRRIRFWEVDANGASITTWKRLEYGETEKRIDAQIVVQEGRIMA